MPGPKRNTVFQLIFRCYVWFSEGRCIVLDFLGVGRKREVRWGCIVCSRWTDKSSKWWACMNIFRVRYRRYCVCICIDNIWRDQTDLKFSAKGIYVTSGNHHHYWVTIVIVLYLHTPKQSHIELENAPPGRRHSFLNTSIFWSVVVFGGCRFWGFLLAKRQGSSKPLFWKAFQWTGLAYLTMKIMKMMVFLTENGEGGTRPWKLRPY